MNDRRRRTDMVGLSDRSVRRRSLRTRRVRPLPLPLPLPRRPLLRLRLICNINASQRRRVCLSNRLRRTRGLSLSILVRRICAGMVPTIFGAHEERDLSSSSRALVIIVINTHTLSLSLSRAHTHLCTLSFPHLSPLFFLLVDLLVYIISPTQHSLLRLLHALFFPQSPVSGPRSPVSRPPLFSFLSTLQLFYSLQCIETATLSAYHPRSFFSLPLPLALPRAPPLLPLCNLLSFWCHCSLAHSLSLLS